MSVWIAPGASARTRTPCGAASCARVFDSIDTPALDAA